MRTLIDSLGGDFAPAALDLLEQHGRYVAFAVSAGAQATLDLRSLYRRSIHLLGYSGFGLTAHETRERLDLVLEALTHGTVSIPVDRTLALGEVGAALDALADRAVTERSCSRWTPDLPGRATAPEDGERRGLGLHRDGDGRALAGATARPKSTRI